MIIYTLLICQHKKKTLIYMDFFFINLYNIFLKTQYIVFTFLLSNRKQIVF